MGTAGGPAGGTGGGAGAAATAGGLDSPAGAVDASSACTGGADDDSPEDDVAAGTGEEVAGPAAVADGAGVTAGAGSGRVATGSLVLSLDGSTFADSVFGSAAGFALS